MKARSCFSTNLDPYRAGFALGEQLAEVQPEVIFLFPTIHYDGSAELSAAIYDALGSEEPILIGCTGDGFYERERVGGAGVSALGINTGGAVTWHLEVEPGVGKTPFEAVTRCMGRLNDACEAGDPAFYFLSSDYRTDTSEIAAAIAASARAPAIGGTAGDDISFERCFVYANREVVTDQVAILAADGPLQFDIRLAHNLQPVGRPGRITKSEGTIIHTIDDIPAMDFIEQELGSRLNLVDEGIITFKLTGSSMGAEHQVLSARLPEDRLTESYVQLFGRAKGGDIVQVCLASPEKILHDVVVLGESLDSVPFRPSAGVIVSCAGRKQVLADRISEEVTTIVKECSSLEALVGFPSFGEFAPVRGTDGFSPCLFHNMTFVLLLLGDAAK